MGDKKGKLTAKLAKAKESLVKAEEEIKRLSDVQKNLDYFRARVKKLEGLLSKV